MTQIDEVKIVTLDDDLQQLVTDINQSYWDSSNEISVYDVQALTTYLGRADTVFIACYSVGVDSRTLLGIASARIEIKPYGNIQWLYVDEVDVCANQRRNGVGKALMQKLFGIGIEAGCEEVWLGAEAKNKAANALYQSLDPDDIGKVTGYTFEFDD